MNKSDWGGRALAKGARVALVALALALFVQVAGAQAKGERTISVTTTEDGGRGSLRQAIAEAQAGDTIAVPAGTYVLTRGELKIDKALTIAGAGAARTTVDGAGSTRAFGIRVGNGSDTPVTISGLTVAHGLASTPEAASGTISGSAILSVNANLTLQSDVITHNSAEPLVHSTEKTPVFRLVDGGAVFASGGAFTMIDTTVSENLATIGSEGEAGGLIFGGAVGVEGTEPTLVEDSKVIDNRAEVLDEGFSLIAGGGMRILANGPGAVIGSSISGNVARSESGFISGGGMHILAEPTKLGSDELVNNVADPGAGSAEAGGLSFSGIGGMTESTLEGNRVLGEESFGGNLVAEPGVFLEEHELRISHSSILHGVAPAGSENCATTQEATILSFGFNRESTDQCGFHAEGDEVNVG